MIWRLIKPRRDDDLEEEIQAHLAIEADQRVADGESAADAELAARRVFGNVGIVKEVTREMWGWNSLDTLIQDLLYAGRMMRKNIVFTRDRGGDARTGDRREYRGLQRGECGAAESPAL